MLCHSSHKKIDTDKNVFSTGVLGRNCMHEDRKENMGENYKYFRQFGENLDQKLK